MNDMEFARRTLHYAMQRGVQAAEVAVVRTRKTEISVVNMTPETVNAQEEIGFGVRVLKDARMGFAASNRLDSRSVQDLLDSLVSIVGEHTPDEANTLPEWSGGKPWEDRLSTFDEVILRTPLEEKVRRALTLEQCARDFDTRIKGASTVIYGDVAEEEALVNSRGVEGVSRSTLAYAVIEAIAGDKDSIETGWHVGASSTYDGLDIEATAATAARRALRMVGSRPAQSAELPLVFPPEVGSDILAYISRMLDADAVQKGKSLFRGREDSQVASSLVSVVDDGRLEGGLATRLADAEGVPTARTELVRDGVLKGFLYDSYTAKKGGTVSTGNAQRGSYAARPHTGTTNFMLLPGSRATDTLLHDVSIGLHVAEMQGLHAAINPVSGDFSIPCKGLMIRGGELAEPVTGVAISGNLFDLLRDVDGVGDDFTWVFSGAIVGTPTFRVRKVKIGSAS